MLNAFTSLKCSYHSLVIFFRVKTEEVTENDILMDLNEVSDEEMADEMVFGGKKPVEDITDLQEEVTEEMAEEMFSGSGKPVKVITESIEPNRPNSTVECTSSTN